MSERVNQHSFEAGRCRHCGWVPLAGEDIN